MHARARKEQRNGTKVQKIQFKKNKETIACKIPKRKLSSVNARRYRRFIRGRFMKPFTLLRIEKIPSKREEKRSKWREKRNTSNGVFFRARKNSRVSLVSTLGAVRMHARPTQARSRKSSSRVGGVSQTQRREAVNRR